MGLSVKALKAATQRELVFRDAAAAERRRTQAERAADVRVHGLGDGMAELRAVMPQPLAAATFDALDSYARMAKDDGHESPIGQLRVGLLADSVLRPWDTSRPSVTANLTVVAPLDALRAPPARGEPTDDKQPVGPPHPAEVLGEGAERLARATCASPARAPAAGAVPPVGEVDGQPITARQLRELLHQLDALCPGGLQAPAGGSLTIAVVEPAAGELRATVTRPELERLVRHACAAHPKADCACAVLDRPPASDRYRPTPKQRQFVRTRDRTCRYPGCGNKAAWADLDHVIPHARGGSTDCVNLCCLCRRHHRLKTHAPGWRFAMSADGVLTVTTPSGITRTTRPPGLVPSGGPAPERPRDSPMPSTAPRAGGTSPGRLAPERQAALLFQEDPPPF
jgi:hypothetical protein